jgi:hypothetical protein
MPNSILVNTTVSRNDKFFFKSSSPSAQPRFVPYSISYFAQIVEGDECRTFFPKKNQANNNQFCERCTKKDEDNLAKR